MPHFETLTPRAKKYVETDFVRYLLTMTDADWQSLFDYRDLEMEREFIVDGIIEMVEQKIEEAKLKLTQKNRR